MLGAFGTQCCSVKVADPSFRGTLGHRKLLKISAQTLEYSTPVITTWYMDMNFVNSTMHYDAGKLYLIVFV